MSGYYDTEFSRKVSDAAKEIAAGGGNQGKIEAILFSLMTPGEAREIVSDGGGNPLILWVPQDVKSLRPGWSDEECAEALDDARKSLVDRSIECGWDVLSCCIDGYEERRGQA